MKFEKFSPKEKYDIDDLVALLAYLRSPAGCPWDQKQTSASIKHNLIEETYEAVEAIDSGNPETIKDELGDVLMQVVFHAQFATEKEQFSFEDVVNHVCQKLVSRHTHVFGADKANNAAEALATWEQSKKREKPMERLQDRLHDVGASLPALLRAEKVHKRASKAGFDWSDVASVRAKLHEELAEIVEVETNLERAEDELGDLLLATVVYAYWLKVNPELALHRATDKFIRRVSIVEALALEQGQSIEEMTESELVDAWSKAKEAEHEIR